MDVMISADLRSMDVMGYLLHERTRNLNHSYKVSPEVPFKALLGY